MYDCANLLPNEKAFAQAFHHQLLSYKTRFPVIESATLLALQKGWLNTSIINEIISFKSIGGYVMAGMYLQKLAENDAEEAFSLAELFIISGNQWYVCDIVGERVMGHTLLTQPQKAFPLLCSYKQHTDKWLVRTIGVATHYAVKKGLKPEYVEKMFLELLELAHVTEFHTKKGIGWGVKTIAKFYPTLIHQYQKQLSSENIRPWFHTKIRMGLSRAHKYEGKFNQHE